MAGTYSPKIVTDNIVLHLDAGNPKSYVGSGTSWRDLSGGGYHATMYGTVPYETDTTPCFNFGTASGTYSYNVNMGFTFGGNMVPTTGDFTFSCWIKNPNNSSGQVGLFSNAGGADGYRFGIGTDGIYYLIAPGYQEGNVSFSSVLSSSLWYNVVCVYNRTAAKILLYRNGVYQAQTSIPVSQTAFTAVTPGMVRSSCCGVYTGKIANFMVYSKALSADEVLLNYSALKGRFGY